jgi:two-component system, OmpR family, sensor kinase
MAGLQARVRDSLRLRLSLGLAAAIAAVALLAAAWSYWSTAAEANELQDDSLRQVAALLWRQPDLAPALASRARDADRDSSLVVQRLGAPAAPAGVALALPADLAEGIHTVTLQGVSYRVFVRTLADGGRIAVSQQTDVRDEITRDSALRSLTPLLLLMPLLALVVGALVRRMIAPVEALSRDVQARSQHDLQPLPTADVPAEIRPFIEAVNGLFGRLAAALDAQRRFVADAAHELRSPLAALSLQAERLGDVALPEPARERLTTLQRGLQRARHLLDQLLGYARAQAERPQPAAASLSDACRAAIEDLLPLAEAKTIDLGMLPGDDELRVCGDAADLIGIARNLVDNALRYTPPGGRVDVRVSHQGRSAVLEVADNGPGIPAADRDRVLDPFFRLPGAQGVGSGLGLAIVRSTVARLGGRLSLDDVAAPASGLHVRVELPLAAPAPPTPATPATPAPRDAASRTPR